MTDPIKLALEALEKIAAYRPGSTDAGMSPWDAKAALAALDAIPQPAPVTADAELDALQHRLRSGRGTVHDWFAATDALSALRTRLAEARRERETCPRCGKHVSYDCGCEDHQVLAVMVDPRDHADALAALARRDAQMRAEGMRAAAVVAYDEEDESHPRPWENWGEYRNMVTAQTVAKEIRDALLALAAQTEEAGDTPAIVNKHRAALERLAGR